MNKRKQVKSVCHDFIVYTPIILEENNVTLSFIDAGCIVKSKVKGIKMALGLVMPVNCAIVCIKAGRWSAKLISELEATYHILKGIGFKDHNLLFVLTHSDLYSDKTMKILRNDIYKYVSKKYKSYIFQHVNVIHGCFYLKDDIVAGGKQALNRVEDSLDRLKEYLSAMKSINIKTGKNQKPLKNIEKHLKRLRDREEKKFRNRSLVVKIPKFDINLSVPVLKKGVASHRFVLMVGQTGSGKSSIINLFFQGRDDEKKIHQKSHQSISQLTSQCLRTTPFLMKSNTKHNLSYTCTIIDTIGFGDMKHSVKSIKDALTIEFHNHMPRVSKILFTVNITTITTTIIDELDEVLKWLIEIVKVKSENVLFLFTHCDFCSSKYVHQSIARFRLRTSFDKLITAKNTVFAVSPNLREVHKGFVKAITITRNNLRLRLFAEIARANNSINAGQLVAKRYAKILKQKSAQEINSINKVLKVIVRVTRINTYKGGDVRIKTYKSSDRIKTYKSSDRIKTYKSSDRIKTYKSSDLV